MLLFIHQPLGSHTEASRSACGTPGPSHTPMSAAFSIDTKSALEAALGLPFKCNPFGVMQISLLVKIPAHVFLLETGEVRGDVKPDV